MKGGVYEFFHLFGNPVYQNLVPNRSNGLATPKCPPVGSEWVHSRTFRKRDRGKTLRNGRPLPDDTRLMTPSYSRKWVIFLAFEGPLFPKSVAVYWNSFVLLNGSPPTFHAKKATKKGDVLGDRYLPSQPKGYETRCLQWYFAPPTHAPCMHQIKIVFGKEENPSC
jgi:hypothetical protein